MYPVNISIKILALIISIAVLLNISAFDLDLGYIYYGIMVFSLILLLVLGKKPKVNYWILILILGSTISIIFNDIPYFFRPYERLLAFIFVIALIGPFLRTEKLNMLKWQLLKTINLLIVLVVFVSFVGLILDSTLVYYGRGGFTGFFNHSMILSPMAAISMLICIDYANNYRKRNYKLFFYGLSILSFVTCVASGSRAAIIAGILAILVYFYKSKQDKLTYSFRLFLLLSSIVVLAFPLWEKYTEVFIGKLEYAEERGDFAVTRTHLWERRIKEINSSPIYGIGYSNDSSLSINDLYKGTGQVEPGSSWLAILAMTGFLGFIPFVCLFFSLFYFTYKNHNSIFRLLSSLIAFFAIHMIAEGYVLSAGSGLFFYMWLLLGVTSVFQKQKEIQYSNINY